MRITITDHAALRAEERLGWDRQTILETLEQITLRGGTYTQLAGTEFMNIKVNGVTFTLGVSDNGLCVVTVV